MTRVGSVGSSLRAIVLCGLAALLLSACATGTTTVLSVPEERKSYEAIEIVRGEDTVEVDPEVVGYFEGELKDYLFNEAKFQSGEGLTLRVRFIQLDKGSQFMRYMIGMGAGKGTMTIEGVYVDGDGNEVAKIHVGGEISAGFFGGDFREAVSKAAKEMGEYTVATFY